jgi:hypothetical protein
MLCVSSNGPIWFRNDKLRYDVLLTERKTHKWFALLKALRKLFNFQFQFVFQIRLLSLTFLLQPGFEIGGENSKAREAEAGVILNSKARKAEAGENSSV